MGTLTASSLLPQSDGSYGRVDCDVAFGSSYNNTGNDATTGETLTAASLGLAQILSVTTPSEEAGYGFQVLGLANGPASSVRIKVFQGGSGTTGGTTVTGTNGTSAVTGTGTGTVTPLGSNGTSAVTGTGTYTDGATSGALNLASPLFSGTGLTAAGQVITTTDNQTMTLNQCAGMWLISATGATPPNLILSNTAVSGAPAVFTVQGSANTDAGAYKVVKSLTVGTVSALSGTAAAQTFTGASSAVTVSALTATAAAQTWTATGAHTHTIGAGAGGEVPNGTDLSTSLAVVRLTVSGF